MFWRMPQTFEFSDEHERILRETRIDESGPGTILYDFTALIDYVGEGKQRVTSTHKLPLKSLGAINERMARPIKLRLSRPVMKSYPTILGLYLLLRASGLTYVDESGKTPYLKLNDETIQQWQELNATERYFTLLETWFLRGRGDILGERSHPSLLPENFFTSTALIDDIPPEGLQVAGNRHVEDRLGHIPGQHNLGLLHLFGLIDVEEGTPQEGEGWRIKWITRTRFGRALLGLLYTKFFSDFKKIQTVEQRPEIPYGVLLPVVQPYFPEWQSNLSLSEQPSRVGTHMFKVSLGSLWRRIAVPHDVTLDALASAILNSVQFDHDHLYEFTYANRFGSQESVQHPYMEEGPWTSEMLVGELAIGLGQTMTFIYDFGDWWEFKVVLEELKPEMEVDDTVVLEQHGEPPEQYPSWDDEYE